MSDKFGDLVFLDEFRIKKELNNQLGEEEIEDYEYDDEIPDDIIDDYHFNYLTATDLASLTPLDVRWIIKHLISRTDFEWRKEEAEKMIDEILEDREKE